MKNLCGTCGRKSEFVVIRGPGASGPVCPFCNPHDNRTYKAWLKDNNVPIKPLENVPEHRPRNTPFLHKCLDCKSEYTTYISLVLKKIKGGKISCHTCDRKRSHRPDIFLPKRNQLVEVKSLWTLGLHKPNRGFNTKKTRAQKWKEQCLKYKAARREGFKYTLLVMSPSGERLTIPKDWFDYSFREMFIHLESQYRLPG